MSPPVRTTRARRAAPFAALTAAAALLLVLAPLRAGAQTTTAAVENPKNRPARHAEVIDQGAFIISVRGEPVRAEEFIIQRSDTLVVRASSTVSLPGQGPQPADKSMVLVVGPLDFAMGNYWSQQIAGTDTLRRGVEVTPGDTVMTIWREVDRAGTGTAITQPPGRMYILDPPLFTTFNFLGWTLHGKACDRRPITVFVLGARDSLVEGTVTDVGNETIRWGGRPTLARKLLIADQTTSFTGWYSPADGRMLRLEQARDSIRVERKAPPLKRQPPRKK